jgi:hypothetical protein
MRRSDIARVSIIPDGADYIFILLERIRARSRRVIMAVNLLAVYEYDALSHHPVWDGSVVTGSYGNSRCR